MALIICKECGKEYSDKAPCCPNCGCPTEGFISTEQTGYDVSQQMKEPLPVAGKSHSNKKIIFISLGAGLLVLMAAFLWYWFLCPKTVTWCCYHKTKAATCTDPEKCSRCGKEFAEPLGHKWIDGTCTTPKTCSVCGKTKGQPLGHTWKEATCTEPKTCTICNVTEGEPNSHKWKSATCTEAKKCTVCGEKYGSALGHNIKDYVCSRCKETFVYAKDIPNIIEFSNCKYSINYVGGVEVYFKLTNKSSTKTIKYVRMNMEFYNQVGDKVRDDISNKNYFSGQWVGPLSPNKSEQVSTGAVFYNSSVKGYGFTYLEIEYTDGTILKINDKSACSKAIKY